MDMSPRVFLRVVWEVDIRLGIIRACKLGDNFVKVSEWNKPSAFLILSMVHWKQKQVLERYVVKKSSALL